MITEIKVAKEALQDTHANLTSGTNTVITRNSSSLEDVLRWMMNSFAHTWTVLSSNSEFDPIVCADPNIDHV